MFRVLESKFVTLPQEELILVKRKHWSVFVFPALMALAIGILSLTMLLFLYPFFPGFFLLLISAFALVFIFIITLVLKSAIDWYFNLYVVTNRKITEISYKPLSSREVNEVLLDQVRCTEIDTRVEGFVNELLDVGDVIITFDRPTHQEEFTIANIWDPKSVETLLHRTLSPLPDVLNYPASDNNSASLNDGWYVKGRENEGKWKYIKNINS